MIKTTTWSPDTCRCVVEYVWDTEAPPASRKHTLKQFVKRCPAHATGSSPGAYAAITDENTRKNILRSAILKDFPALAVIDRDGNEDFADDFSWSFDDQRRLIVTLPNVPSSMLVNIQSLANSTFGIGKVIVS